MKKEYKEIALYNSLGLVIGYIVQLWMEDSQGIMQLYAEKRTYF